ncbi:hypothetical protein AAU61_13220 [Desulfocarbo indianensis]|nr:hypothetical protein AAU61_13220 [Desulfocarbo indianensis]
MFEDRDLWAAYYAQKLWSLLPEVYRASDSDHPEKDGPLRELVERLAEQIAWMRRSIERTWENQSIESCDDWLIPYLGDLLACNLVAGLDARGQRLDVAKTIYYRRCKGTLGVLEEIASDITGWSARAVEFFRHLSRTRHAFDPPIGLDRPSAVLQGLAGTRSGSPAGGFADLRFRVSAQDAHGPFDEFHHFADFRRGRAWLGWYNIPKLGFFLWRLHSFGCALTTPVEDAACPGQFTFDPSGREIALFAANRRDQSQYGDAWVTPDEWMLPTAISHDLWLAEKAKLYPDSLALYRVGNNLVDLLPIDENPIMTERGRFDLKAVLPVDAIPLVAYHYGFSSRIGAGPYDRRALDLEEIGQPAAPETEVAGGDNDLAVQLSALGVSGMATVKDSLTYNRLDDLNGVANLTISTEQNQRPLVRLTEGAWLVQGAAEDSRLALEGLWLCGNDLVLRGEFQEVALTCVTLDPGEELDDTGKRPVAVDDQPLAPTTLWIEGNVGRLIIRRSICGPIRARLGGVVGETIIQDSIVQGMRGGGEEQFQPGEIIDSLRLAQLLKMGSGHLLDFLRDGFTSELLDALQSHDGESIPTAELIGLMVEGLNAALAREGLYQAMVLEQIGLPQELEDRAATIVPGADPTRLNRKLLEAAYPHELGQAALALGGGELHLVRTAILGRAFARRISASETIFSGFARAEDVQDGCVRFSAYVRGSLLRQPYESVQIRERNAVFASQRFGRPNYAQLARLADLEIITPEPGDSILTGAENGSEMGAFALEKNPIKERGLLIKLREYMPIGLTPVLIYQS